MKLKIIRPNTVIHCKTREESECLLNELHKSGIKWRSGDSLEKHKFDADSPLGTGYWFFKDMRLGWAEISYFTNRTVEYGEIIPFSSLVIAEKTYEDGLNDAWVAANKLADMTGDTLNEVFGFNDAELIRQGTTPFGKAMSLTPQEAIAKLEAYEADKKINVGDVVVGNIFKGVVTGICNGRAFIMYDDGSSKEISIDKCQKTGKHIDISSVLAEIGRE